MDEPIVNLLDAFYDHGLSWEEAKQIARPIEHEEDMMRLAEWLKEQPQATIPQIRKEMHRLLRKRAI